MFVGGGGVCKQEGVWKGEKFIKRKGKKVPMLFGLLNSHFPP